MESSDAPIIPPDAVAPPLTTSDSAQSHTVLTHHPGLDGVRAVAALLVVGLHAAIPGFANGWIGVDIFFTLSGFLITSILLKDIGRHGAPRYRRFYVRRALRLLPAYFAVVVIAVLGDFFIDAGGTLKGAVYSTIYLANWAAAAEVPLGSLGHMWSLSIEEQFYIVWPALLFLLIRAGARWHRSTLGLLLVIMAVTYATTVTLLAAGVSDVFLWNATPARSIQLLAGAALALGLDGVRRHARPWLPIIGATGMVGLIGHLVLPTVSNDTAIVVTWPVVSLCTCAVIASVVIDGRGATPKMLAARPMVAIGKVSYGLYLWHYVVFTTLDAAVGLDTWGPRLVGLALTAVVVPLSYVLIERPFLRLKERTS